MHPLLVPSSRSTSLANATMVLFSARPAIAIPVYEPRPYALSGLTFDELPYMAKYYLEYVVGTTSPNQVAPEDVCNLRLVLRNTFWRTVQGNDEALVKAWRAMGKAQREAAEALHKDEQENEQEATQRFRSWYDDYCALLGERALHYHEFVAKFNALVWLELEGRATSDKLSAEEEQRYRNEECGLKDALLWPKTVVENLDRHVVKMLNRRDENPVKTEFENTVFNVTHQREPLTAGPVAQAQSHEPSSARRVRGRRRSFPAEAPEAGWRNPRPPRPSRDSEGASQRGDKGWGNLKSQPVQRTRSSTSPANNRGRDTQERNLATRRQ